MHLPTITQHVKAGPRSYLLISLLLLSLGCAAPGLFANAGPTPEPTRTSPSATPRPTQTNQPAGTPEKATPEATATTVPARKAVQIPTTAPTATLEIAACPPNNPSQLGAVLDIVDGVTLRVIIDGATYTVRYHGVLAPAPGAYYAAEARQKNADLAFAKIITLIPGEMDRDANGTLLRYVVQEGVLLNTELLEQGALALDPAFSESACLSSFQAAQQTAQLANRGQWGAPPTPIAVLVQPQPVILVPVVDSGGGTGGSGLEAVCSCAGNSLNCSDFSTHRAAQACHDYCQSQGTGDIHGLDGNDNDGLACESLP